MTVYHFWDRVIKDIMASALPSLGSHAHGTWFRTDLWSSTVVATVIQDQDCFFRTKIITSKSPAGFPSGRVVKNLPTNAGNTGEAEDVGSIPGSGSSHGVGNGNPFQYSCLENSMDGRAWWATVHRVTKSQTWLSDRNIVSQPHS